LRRKTGGGEFQIGGFARGDQCLPGCKDYGKTRRGKDVTEADVIKAGYGAAAKE
jgi:hypothetical protein